MEAVGLKILRRRAAPVPCIYRPSSGRIEFTIRQPTRAHTTPRRCPDPGQARQSPKPTPTSAPKSQVARHGYFSLISLALSLEASVEVLGDRGRWHGWHSPAPCLHSTVWWLQSTGPVGLSAFWEGESWLWGESLQERRSRSHEGPIYHVCRPHGYHPMEPNDDGKYSTTATRQPEEVPVQYPDVG